MAGTIKSNVVQLGDSATATQNFVLQTNVNGTATLARGNVGATTQDILTVDSSGKPQFPQLLQSLDSAGYITMPGGLIIQWGQGSLSPNGATYVSTNITLSVAFTTATYQVFATLSTPVSNQTMTVAAANSTLSQIAVYMNSVSSVPNQSFSWLAIGK